MGSAGARSPYSADWKVSNELLFYCALLFPPPSRVNDKRTGSSLARCSKWNLVMVRGRAIAQAVSRRLPTAVARVQTRVWSCGIL
jgi:hypothetical protein